MKLNLAVLGALAASAVSAESDPNSVGYTNAEWDQIFGMSPTPTLFRGSPTPELLGGLPTPTQICPTGRSWSNAGSYCFSGKIYHCTYPGARGVLIDDCAARGTSCQVNPPGYPDQCRAATSSQRPIWNTPSWGIPSWGTPSWGNVNNAWLPVSVLDGKQCSSTYMASGNTITCPDGTTWEDNEFNQVRQTNTNRFPTGPTLPTWPTWGRSSQSPTFGSNGVWFDKSVMDGRGCPSWSTYMAFGNTFECKDGTRWVDNAEGLVRQTGRSNA